MIKKITQYTEADLPTAYKADLFEDPIYQSWEKAGAFKPVTKRNSKKKPFTIIMPPPNATGTLHLGHASMLALQDIMIRYHRMKGEPTLWIPGTDHAAIATQNKVEKLLAEHSITRHDLGRKKFIEEVEEFVKGSQSTIRNQVRKMGSSCDWSRETYTLDAGPSLAVRTVFKQMYDDGLIYRGNRIVNWCPRCQSTLADDEVKYKEVQSKFYYLKYGPFIIGTARPETKFLDKVVVVHPDDKRYKKYLGKSFDVPWINGMLKATVIGDKASDPEFGSGAMTITPAHSMIDFEIAQRHKFEIVKIIDEKGNLTDAAGKEFAGMNAKLAREKIIEKLQEKGLVDRIDENYRHNLSICYRCDTTIEPLTSTQWFISVDKKIPKRNKTLKQLSIEVVKNGKIEILPEKFEKIYTHWMGNLHDWCISRQIWFGHQIPVWYCKNCKAETVEIDTPQKCKKCKSSELQQDPDVLDTWFSSGLWTFSTLGWPKKTSDLKTFHPTSVLETGYDILFFWVARMILMTTYALNEVPFKTVYLHGLVRTRNGEKMSKSKPETCIDPLDMIAKYGADALRLSMVIGGGPGNDIRLYEEKIAGFRNFVNKIWNVTRFILLNTTPEDLAKSFNKKDVKTTADKWILTRLQKLIKESTQLIEKYHFSEAGMKIYDFLWNEMADWYLEFSKGEHKNPAVLLHVLRDTLKLLHPFVPYITEALWEKLGMKQFIMLEEWPVYNASLIFSADAKKIEKIYTLITEIRKVRAEYKLDPAKKFDAVIFGGALTTLLKEKEQAIKRLANLENITLAKKGTKPAKALSIMASGVEVYIPFDQMFDIEKELERIKKELTQHEKDLAGLEGRLHNKTFLSSAPKEVVEQVQSDAARHSEAIAKLKEHELSLKKAG